MTPDLLRYLLIGTFLMAIPIALVATKYKISVWKWCLITILLTFFGTLGTILMYYVENGGLGGLSFYGAVFLVPAVFILISLILRIPYGKLMDLCAIGECIMLALMKVSCILSGCCIGRVLFISEDGTPVLFPSREVELLVALILFGILLTWAIKGRHHGQLYAWYFVLYGSTRFILNIFREAWVIKVMLLPFGNIWSLVSIAIGVLWLIIAHTQKRKVDLDHDRIATSS